MLRISCGQRLVACLVLAVLAVVVGCVWSRQSRSRSELELAIECFEIGRTRESDFREEWLGRNTNDRKEIRERLEAGRSLGILKESSGFDSSGAYVSRYYMGKMEDGNWGMRICTSTRLYKRPQGYSEYLRAIQEPDVEYLRHRVPHVTWVFVFSDGLLDSSFAPPATEKGALDQLPR